MKSKLLCIFLVVLVAQAHVTQASLLGSLLGGVVGVVNTLTSTVLTALSNIVTSALNSISGVLTNVNQVLTIGVTTLEGLTTGITTAAATTLAGGLATVDKLMSNATGAITGIVNNVAQTTGTILTTIPAALTDKTLLNGIKQAVGSLTSAIAGSGLTDALSQFTTQLPNMVSHILGGVSTTLQSILPSLPTLLTGLVNTILGLLQRILDQLPSTTQIVGLLDNVQSVMSSLGANDLNKIKTAVAGGDTKLTGITAPITAALNTALKELLAKTENLVSSFDGATKNLQYSTGTVASIITDTIKQFTAPLFANLSKCPEKVADANAALIANATAAATSCITAQTSTLTNLMNQLTASMTTLKSDPFNLKIGALTTLATAITNSATTVAQVPTTLYACFSTAVTSMAQKATPALTSLTC